MGNYSSRMLGDLKSQTGNSMTIQILARVGNDHNLFGLEEQRLSPEFKSKNYINNKCCLVGAETMKKTQNF